jgi:hypothetical protein
MHSASDYFAPAEYEALPGALETSSVRLKSTLISLSTFWALPHFWCKEG